MNEKKDRVSVTYDEWQTVDLNYLLFFYNHQSTKNTVKIKTEQELDKQALNNNNVKFYCFQPGNLVFLNFNKHSKYCVDDVITVESLVIDPV